MAATPLALYLKQYPSASEIEQFTRQELQTLSKTLEDEVGLIEEETRMFEAHLQLQREKERVTGGAGGHDEDEEEAHHVTTATTGGKRRGRAYRRKDSEPKEVLLRMEDHLAVATAEQERLRHERERTEKVLEEARDLIRATIEEAQNRLKEVKMELAFFKREVASDKDVSAEKILKYFADRPVQKENYLRKLREKNTALHQSISKASLQLRQREDVGEAFHHIDFDQLKIENHQFNERIDQKNRELVELKGTTTRTVQTLNNLTDKLNTLLSEQQRLRKELRLRHDHVEKLKDEIEVVKREGAIAAKRNTALKIQNEAVKVPKVEDYIAQKAEMYELQKAAQNWQRKVEIAEGHTAVMKQQMLSLKKKAETMS